MTTLNEKHERGTTLNEKLERGTRYDMVEFLHDVRAEDLCIYSKILLEQLGKEKAIGLVKKARWDARYEMGRKTAEDLGHPKDMETFVEAYDKRLDSIFYIPPVENRLIAKNKAIMKFSMCFLGEAILRRKPDKDLLDVLKAYCNHDEGWAGGWNPDMKCEKIKYILDGDDSCDFLFEVEE